jgi:hypothetical protein
MLRFWEFGIWEEEDGRRKMGRRRSSDIVYCLIFAYSHFIVEYFHDYLLLLTSSPPLHFILRSKTWEFISLILPFLPYLVAPNL